MSHAPMTDSQQSHALWSLGASQALRLPVGPGPREIQVLDGRVWLTRNGDAQSPSHDMWLAAGDSLVLAAGSGWVLEAWGDARFQLLVPPCGVRPASRFSAWSRVWPRVWSSRRTSGAPWPSAAAG